MVKIKNMRLAAVAVMAILIGTGSVWAFSGAGSGTSGDPYVITDVYQLQEMQNDLGAYYVLGNDIDASETATWNGGAGFEPVGTDTDFFTGVLNGQGYSIENLYIDRINYNRAGCFGRASGVVIKNVNLLNVNVKCDRGGTLVGAAYEGSIITNCSSTGTVTVKSGSGDAKSGGLIGSAGSGSHIDQCWSDVDVNAGRRRQVGGLIGYLRGQGYITLLTNSYSRGTVTGSGFKQGNLLGDADDSRVDKCYSSGYGKALIGFNWGHPVITNCYWDKDKGASSSSYGGSPRTTSQMMQQATFVNWDFDEIWDIDEGQSYPYFMEPRIEGLEIVGSDEVAENSQAQYKAIAHYDIGSLKDVTDSAEWLVEPNDIASITAGLLTTEIIDLPENVMITAVYSEGENTQEAQKDVSIFAICPSGSALEFDGVDDYVECGNDESLDITDEITVSAWIKRSNFNTHGVIVGKNNGNSVTAGYGLFLYEQGFEFNFYSGGGWRRTTPRVSTGPNQWHHIAATFDGNNTYLYIDGEQKASLGYVGTITPAVGHSLHIAYWRPALPEYFDGFIDEVAIYNRALSVEQILVLMHSRPEAGEPNLVAYWDFDEGEGQVAGDLAGGNHGILGFTSEIDDSDPNWTDSIPLVGDICSLEGIVERNLLNVSGMKNDVLDILDEAIGKEEALWEYMDTVFKDRDFGNTNKGDVVKAKQKIYSAIQQEEQAETAVEQSIDKLDDALNTLGIE